MRRWISTFHNAPPRAGRAGRPIYLDLPAIIYDFVYYLLHVIGHIIIGHIIVPIIGYNIGSQLVASMNYSESRVGKAWPVRELNFFDAPMHVTSPLLKKVMQASK